MNILDLTTEAVRQYIPNVLTEVEGETPVALKLMPFIDSAKQWIEREYLGPDDFLSDAHNELAMRIVVLKAFADAIPALDLIVTPTGMAVVNTDNMAPASKERVERLIDSLNTRIARSIPILLDFCRTYEVWRQSERGQYFSSTFLNYPTECYGIPALKKLSYCELRLRAIVIEQELADRYLGHTFMDKLRSDYSARVIDRTHTLVSLIISSVLSFISDDGHEFSTPNRLWHAARRVINSMVSYPEFKQLWESEMGDRFNNAGFVNNIKGAFYF